MLGHDTRYRSFAISVQIIRYRYSYCNFTHVALLRYWLGIINNVTSLNIL